MKCVRVSGVQLMVPHLIIVGGGFGGLSAARALRGAAVRVTLINKRNYHLFRPMLCDLDRTVVCHPHINRTRSNRLANSERLNALSRAQTFI